ncbi:MAG: hypothetical protein ABFD66_13820 [Smithella sp.]
MIGTFNQYLFAWFCCNADLAFYFQHRPAFVLPTNQSIGMELARDGKTDRILGQLSGIANISAIIGSFAVVIGFKF